MLRKIANLFTRRRPNDSTQEQENNRPGRSFENPHQCTTEAQAVQVFSEITPGLGRKVPEMVAAQEAGIGIVEMTYKVNYERRVDWAYSPRFVPFYKTEISKQYLLRKDRRNSKKCEKSPHTVISSSSTSRKVT